MPNGILNPRFHCHVYKANKIGTPDHVPGNEQLPTIFACHRAAMLVVDELNAIPPVPSQPRSYYFLEVCRSDLRLCALKVNGLSHPD